MVADLVPGVSTPFDEDEQEPLYRAFRNILRTYNQVLPAFGGKGLKLKHTWVLERQQKRESARTLLPNGPRNMPGGIQCQAALSW